MSQNWGISETFVWNSAEPTADRPRELVNVSFRAPTPIALTCKVPTYPEFLQTRTSQFAILKLDIGIGRASTTEFWEPNDCTRNITCTSLRVTVHNRCAVLPRTQQNILTWGLPGDPLKDFWSTGINSVQLDCWASVGRHANPLAYRKWTFPKGDATGTVIFTGAVPEFADAVGMIANVDGQMMSGSAFVNFHQGANLTLQRFGTKVIGSKWFALMQYNYGDFWIALPQAIRGFTWGTGGLPLQFDDSFAQLLFRCRQ